jgi:hypothetical protein
MYKIERCLIKLGIEYKYRVICEELNLYKFEINNNETIINCDPLRKCFQIISNNINLEYKTSRGIINRLHDIYKHREE